MHSSRHVKPGTRFFAETVERVASAVEAMRGRRRLFAAEKDAGKTEENPKGENKIPCRCVRVG